MNKEKINKIYLIIFFHGKRYVQDLQAFNLEMPTILSTSDNKPFMLSGNYNLIRMFNLVGKHKIDGKKSWNKFLDKLKI